MKLTEVLISIAVFLIVTVVLTASLINVRRSIAKTEHYSESLMTVMNKDMFVRKTINEIRIPYWKNFDSVFDEIKKNLEIEFNQQGIHVMSVSTVYDKRNNAEGIRVEWKYNNKVYISQEFIKQRLVNVE